MDDADENKAALGTENGAGPEAAGSDLSGELPPAPPGPSLLTRLRVAWAAFLGGLRGLPVSLDGKVPVEHTLAQEKLERELARSRATAEGLQARLQERDEKLKERSGELKELRRELKRLQAEAAKAEGELRRQLEAAEETAAARAERISQLDAKAEEQRASLAERKETIESLERQLEATRREAAGWEDRLRQEAESFGAQVRQRDDRLAEREQELRAQRAAAEKLEQEKNAALGFRQEALRCMEHLEAQLAEKEEAFSALRHELATLQETLAHRENEVRRQLEEATRQQEEMRAEVERWRVAAEQAQKEAAVREVPEKPRKGRPSEETRHLREELEAQQEKVVELEERLKDAEQLEMQRALLERDLQRKTQQVETLLGEHGRQRRRADQMEKLLNEFYTEAVSPLTVAKASLELILTKKHSLGKADQENLNDIQQTLDQLNELLAKLRAQIASAGES